MPRSTTVTKHGRIWIKQDVYSPQIKIEITRDDSTVVDVSSYIIKSEVINGATNYVGHFKIVLSNPEGFFTSDFNGGENVDIWIGYDTLIKQMSGEIDQINYDLSKRDGYMLTISGTAYGSELLSITLITQYENREASTLLTNDTDGILVGTNITHTNVDVTNITYQVKTIRHLTRWDAIKQICDDTEFDAYIDADKDLHFFQAGSIINQTEAAVIGDNLIKISHSPGDRRKVYNFIWVYGKSLEGDVQFIKSEQDSSSQTTYNKRELIIDDSGISTMDGIRERADYELSHRRLPIEEGRLVCLGMPTLNPGEKIRIACPLCFAEGTFIVLEYTHLFSKQEGFTTSITYGKQAETLDKFFKERQIKEIELQTMQNSNKMINSFVLDLDDNTNIGSHNRTFIQTGGLRLSPGFSNGTMTSTIEETDDDVAYYELRLQQGQDLGDSTFDISLDGGNSWDEDLSEKTFYTPINTVGRKLVIKVNLNSTSSNPNPKLLAIGVMYRFS